MKIVAQKLGKNNRHSAVVILTNPRVRVPKVYRISWVSANTAVPQVFWNEVHGWQTHRKHAKITRLDFDQEQAVLQTQTA